MENNIYPFQTIFNLSNQSRASISNGTPSGADQCIGEEHDGVLVMEDIPATEENVYNEIIPTEAPNEDSQEAIAYPNDARVPIKADDDLKQFF